MADNKKTSDATTYTDDEVAEMMTAYSNAVDEAQKLKTKNAVKTGSVSDVTKDFDPMEELVEVNLYYDGDKYVDDVDVCINGERILIKRGMPVKIKRKFALVLEQSNGQDLIAKRMMDEMSSNAKE